MPSGKRGLPATFELEVADDESPAQLGNFLERSLVPPTPPTVAPKPARQRPPLEAVPEPEPAAPPVGEEEPSEDPEVSAEAEAELPQPAPKRRKAASSVRRGKRPPRKEIGLDAQTIDMITTLVRDASEQSAEPDIRASEIVRPLVQAAYEARRHINYRGVGRRGQWGSQTARALITDLKEAFTKAIAEAYGRRSE